MHNQVVILAETDNVATALVALANGQAVEISGGPKPGAIVARDDVQFGHKFALVDIAAGADILKYGEVIGRASRAIAAGEWVHIHNVEAVRARGDMA